MKKPALVWVDRAHIALGSVSGICILAIMGLVTPDVIARKTVSYTIPGASEINILLLVTLIYLGLAGAQARRAHFRVTILTDMLGPSLRRLASIFTTVCTIVFIGFLAWVTGEEAMKSWQSGEMTFGVIAFPVWPSRIAIAVGLTLLTVQLCVELFRLMIGQNPHPVVNEETSP